MRRKEGGISGSLVGNTGAVGDENADESSVVY